MLAAQWKLAHSVLASSMNIGLLHPREVAVAAEEAFRAGHVPLASAEGFIRQVIGWREYVWGVYWLWMPEYRHLNELGATRAVPPAFTGEAPTEMACVRNTVQHLHDHGYAHHIERLMVLGNLALTAGVDPWAMSEWMRVTFVDGAEWVMLPNVVGMALHADGGRMATKPYASGGAYLHKMSDSCRGCRFDPKQRTGERACPFTTLYWDFIARNEQLLAGNHRMARQVAAMRQLRDLPAVRERAVEVLGRLERGAL
jgi:deoxyribodipyrimidine photolyase-related protein